MGFACLLPADCQKIVLEPERSWAPNRVARPARLRAGLTLSLVAAVAASAGATVPTAPASAQPAPAGLSCDEGGSPNGRRSRQRSPVASRLLSIRPK